MTPYGGRLLGRRAFLGTLAGATAWAVAACTRGGSPRRLRSLPSTTLGAAPDPGQLPPSPRRTVRAAGQEFGLPSPFGYTLPPGYFNASYLYDSLLWPDVTGAVVPWLAAQPPTRSPDGLTYTFELRNGVRWHDGQPLTAADVAFTFEYFKTNETLLSPFLLFTPEHVAGVRALGPGTVEIRLDKPAVTFLKQVAAHVLIVPRHVWSRVDNPSRQDVGLLVGSGPYRLDDYAQGEGRYAFAANDDFFLGPPFVKRLELRRVSDELNELVTGGLDLASASGDAVAAGALDPFLDDPAFGVATGPEDFAFTLLWNLARPGPLADPRFRRACAHAIDRAAIVRRVAGGVGAPGNPGYLPPSHPHRVDVEEYRHDPALADRLLDEAGYRRGENGTRRSPDGPPLRFDLIALTAAPAVAELVVADLKKVGIELRIKPVDLLLPLLEKGEFDMGIGVAGGVAGDPDLMRLVYSSRVTKSPFSARGYVNHEFNDVADAQLVAQDEGERRELVGRMQRIVAADLPLLPLYYSKTIAVYRKAVLDQVALHAGGLGPLNKQALVTGTRSGGTTIRPSV